MSWAEIDIFYALLGAVTFLRCAGGNESTFFSGFLLLPLIVIAQTSVWGVPSDMAVAHGIVGLFALMLLHGKTSFFYISILLVMTLVDYWYVDNMGYGCGTLDFPCSPWWYLAAINSLFVMLCVVAWVEWWYNSRKSSGNTRRAPFYARVVLLLNQSITKLHG